MHLIFSERPARTRPAAVSWAVIGFVLALPIVPPLWFGAVTVALGAFLVWLEYSRSGVIRTARTGGAILLVFLVSLSVAAVRATDWRVGAMVLSFVVPGAIVHALMTRHWDDRDAVPLYVAISLCSLAVSAALVIGSVRASLTTLVDGVSFAQHAVWLSGTHLLVVPNDIAVVAVLAAFQFPLLFDRSIRPVLRAAAGAAVVAAIVAIVLSESRTAALALLVSVMVYFGLRSWRTLFVALVAGCLAVAVADQVLGGHLAAKFLAGGPENRLALWSAAWGMFVDKPVLGQGLGAFWTLQSQYLPEWASLRRVVPWAHNLFLETLAEQGVVGGIVLIALFCRGAYVGTQAVRLRSASAACAAAGLAALAAFVVAASFELTLLRRWVPVVLMLILAVLERTRTHQGGGRRCPDATRGSRPLSTA